MKLLLKFILITFVFIPAVFLPAVFLPSRADSSPVIESSFREVLSSSEKSSLRSRLKRLNRSLKRRSLKGDSERVFRISRKISKLRARLSPPGKGEVGTLAAPCTDRNSSVVFVVQNNTDLEVRLVMQGRRLELDGTRPLLSVGKLMPRESQNVVVNTEALVYGKVALTFEPELEDLPVNAANISAFQKKLRVRLPSNNVCSDEVSFQIQDKDFGPDTINIPQPNDEDSNGDIEQGEALVIQCPSELLLANGFRAGLYSQSSAEIDSSGLARVSCEYQWRTGPSVLITASLLEIQFAPGFDYFENFGFNLGCQNSSSTTLFFSPSRQFLLRILDLVSLADRIVWANQLISDFEKAGASCMSK